MKKWTRRGFIEAGLAGSILAGGTLSALSKGADAGPEQIRRTGAKLRPSELKLLGVVIDEIIPYNDGMPSATEAGGVEYLERLSAKLPAAGVELRGALSAISKQSRSQFGKSFAALASAGRVQILTHIEKSMPKTFTSLRDYTYEAYYIQPRVWKLLDYTFYPTNGAGPKMKPFDEAVLANVRRKPKHYREVD